MKILEYFHLLDRNMPRRIMQERRGRGRFVGWLVALSLFALLLALVLWGTEKLLHSAVSVL